MHMCSTICSENVLYAEGEDEGERPRPARKILARGNCTCPRPSAALIGDQPARAGPHEYRCVV